MSDKPFKLLEWSTDDKERGVALIKGHVYSHDELIALNAEIARVLAIGKSKPDDYDAAKHAAAYPGY
jgi:hypothetical protein